MCVKSNILYAIRTPFAIPIHYQTTMTATNAWTRKNLMCTIKQMSSFHRPRIKEKIWWKWNNTHSLTHSLTYKQWRIKKNKKIRINSSSIPDDNVIWLMCRIFLVAFSLTLRTCAKEIAAHFVCEWVTQRAHLFFFSMCVMKYVTWVTQ